MTKPLLMRGVGGEREGTLAAQRALEAGGARPRLCHVHASVGLHPVGRNRNANGEGNAHPLLLPSRAFLATVQHQNGWRFIFPKRLSWTTLTLPTLQL